MKRHRARGLSQLPTTTSFQMPATRAARRCIGCAVRHRRKSQSATFGSRDPVEYDRSTILSCTVRPRVLETGGVRPARPFPTGARTPLRQPASFQSYRSPAVRYGVVSADPGAPSPHEIQSSSHRRQRLWRGNSRSSVVMFRMLPYPVKRRENCSFIEVGKRAENCVFLPIVACKRHLPLSLLPSG